MTVAQDPRPRALVVGSGVSGLSAAYTLSRTHHVTLVEADERLGGHAHTHDVATAAGRQGIDSGFIVHNERTYPVLLNLLRELGIETRATQMSMSVSCAGCGLAYAGGKGAGAILAQPWRVGDPRFLRLLGQVPRFHRAARRVLEAGDRDTTWGEFLSREGFDGYFVNHFAGPLVACVWSAGQHVALDYPAAHLFTFLANHGMLSVGGSPSWRTIVGGSGRYVQALAERLPQVRRGVAVRAVLRHEDGVEVRLADDSVLHADRVVVATHADDALAILPADAPEAPLLARIPYSQNDVVLHRDGSILPVGRARASWNYSRGACSGADTEPVRVDYWMTLLQGLVGEEDYVVSLNAPAIAPEAVVARMRYRHPVFTADSVAAAEKLTGLGGPRLAFAGAHLGWGFHEDGARSGLAAADRLLRVAGLSAAASPVLTSPESASQGPA